MITSLLDTKKFPAKLLAAEYHQRWEVENTIDEFKVHLLERKTHVRSQRPREVVQEFYGLLLGHARGTVINFSSSFGYRDFTIKYLLHGYITSYSSCRPKISAIRTTRTPLFLTWLNLEILDATLPKRVQRNNPRVVKKPVSKFKSKKVKHRGTGIKMNPSVFTILKPPKP